MIKMKAAPIASAMPGLADQDPKVETATDFEIALSHLKQVAHRMKSAGLPRETDMDRETPSHRTER
jgi:hypothetical protein